MRVIAVHASKHILFSMDEKLQNKKRFMKILPCFVIWASFVFVDLIGSFLTPSVLHDSTLSVWLRITLLLHSAIYLSFLVLFVGFIWWICERLLGRFSFAWVYGLSVVGGYIVTVFSLTSWGLYYRMGTFMHLTTIRMLIHNPRQILAYGRHDQRTLFLVSILAILVVTLIVVFIRMIRKMPLNVRTGLSRVFVGCESLCIAYVIGSLMFIYGAYGERMIRDNIGNTYSTPEYYEISFAEKTSPLLTLWSDLQTYFAQDRYDIDLKKFQIRQLPIITLDEYVQRTQREQIKKYNVIFVIIESLRKDVFPVYGGTRNVMPTLEKIAEQGMIFYHAYSQSSHSNYADTGPLSSSYPLRSHSLHFYPENPTYPRVLFYDILKPFGYQTAIFSSQDLSWGGVVNFLRTPNLDQLFYADTWTGVKKGGYPNENDMFAKFMLNGKKLSEELDDSIALSSALDWLKTRKKDAPFAMLLDLQNSHYPFWVPAEFPRRFLKDDPQKIEHLLSTMNYHDLPISTIYDQYCDSLAYTDFGLGIVARYLEEENELKNTIWVITADTGIAFGSTEGKWGEALGNNGPLVEDVVNVPLIIAAPSLSPQKSERYVQHIDILPTVVGLLGLPPHPAFQGKNLLNELKDNESNTIYMVAHSPFAYQYALIDNQWKLIYDKQSNEYTLVDLTAQDAQHVRPHDSKLASQLQEQLQTWITLQIQYYENRYMHEKYYPPVIEKVIDDEAVRN